MKLFKIEVIKNIAGHDEYKEGYIVAKDMKEVAEEYPNVNAIKFMYNVIILQQCKNK